MRRSNSAVQRTPRTTEYNTTSCFFSQVPLCCFTSCSSTASFTVQDELAEKENTSYAVPEKIKLFEVDASTFFKKAREKKPSSMAMSLECLDTNDDELGSIMSIKSKLDSIKACIHEFQHAIAVMRRMGTCTDERRTFQTLAENFDGAFNEFCKNKTHIASFTLLRQCKIDLGITQRALEKSSVPVRRNFDTLSGEVLTILQRINTLMLVAPGYHLRAEANGTTSLAEKVQEEAILVSSHEEASQTHALKW